MANMVEIDEAQLAALQGTAKTIHGMLQNPKSRALLRQAEKAFNPDAVIPEIDAAEPVLAEVRKTNERLEAFEKEQRKRDEAAEAERGRQAVTEQWNKGRAKLRAEGYTDEGIAKIEELMEKRALADHEAAASLYDRLNPAPEPITPVSTRFNPFAPQNEGDEKLKKMLLEGNDEGYLNTIIPQVLSDIRSTPRGR